MILDINMSKYIKNYNVIDCITKTVDIILTFDIA